MSNSGPTSRRTPRFGRRLLVQGVAGFVVGGAGSACGADDPDTAVVEPVETETSLLPTPTQEAIASPVPGYLDSSRWAGRTMTIASLGGDYQDAQRAALFEPFATATGVLVQQTLVGDLADIERQVATATVTWDVVDVPTEEVIALARDDLLTPIDYQTIDRSPLFDQVVMQYAVGAAFFSTVLAYATEMNPAPEGWIDFWNVERFPGGRTLRGGPVGTLEFALLADGVQPESLYPLDADRAFAALDRIRPAVTQWYENTKQPVAMLAAGDATMASTFSVRVSDVEPDVRPEIQWRGGMLAADSWVVPRGAENADIAMDFISFATRAIPCANFSRLQPFGPVNRDAFVYLRQDRLDLMPNTPARSAVQIIQNWAWWAENRDALTERFREWLLTEPVLTPAPIASPRAR